MKKATPNRFLTAGRPGVFKVKMSLGRAMKTTDLNGGLIGGFGTLGPASGELGALPHPLVGWYVQYILYRCTIVTKGLIFENGQNSVFGG